MIATVSYCHINVFQLKKIIYSNCLVLHSQIYLCCVLSAQKNNLAAQLPLSATGETEKSFFGSLLSTLTRQRILCCANGTIWFWLLVPLKKKSKFNCFTDVQLENRLGYTEDDFHIGRSGLNIIILIVLGFTLPRYYCCWQIL